jgi:hypothetical protein
MPTIINVFRIAISKCRNLCSVFLVTWRLFHYVDLGYKSVKLYTEKMDGCRRRLVEFYWRLGFEEVSKILEEGAEMPHRLDRAALACTCGKFIETPRSLAVNLSDDKREDGLFRFEAQAHGSLTREPSLTAGALVRWVTPGVDSFRTLENNEKTASLAGRVIVTTSFLPPLFVWCWGYTAGAGLMRLSSAGASVGAIFLTGSCALLFS